MDGAQKADDGCSVAVSDVPSAYFFQKFEYFLWWHLFPDNSRGKEVRNELWEEAKAILMPEI